VLDNVRLNGFDLRPTKVLYRLSIVRLNHSHLLNHKERILQQLFERRQGFHHFAVWMTETWLWQRHRRKGSSCYFWNSSTWSIWFSLTVCKIVTHFRGLVYFINWS